jgi:hypothetical protein
MEIGARTSQTYPLIKDVQDPQERLKIIKASNAWRSACIMTGFDAQKFINGLFNELIQSGVSPWEMDEIISNIIGSLFDAFTQLATLIPANFEDTLPKEDLPSREVLAKIKGMLDKDSRKQLKAVGKEPAAFFKFWQGVLNRKGNISKRKLLKLVAY